MRQDLGLPPRDVFSPEQGEATCIRTRLLPLSPTGRSRDKLFADPPRHQEHGRPHRCLTAGWGQQLRILAPSGHAPGAPGPSLL